MAVTFFAANSAIYYKSAEKSPRGLLAVLLSSAIGTVIYIGLQYALTALVNRKASGTARQREIAEKDERNIRIREIAGQRAAFAAYILLVLMSYAFYFLDYTVPFCVSAGAFALLAAAHLIFHAYYNKKM
jgi:hypothetical protein